MELKYKIIFMDADETIFDFEGAEKLALKKVIEESNFEYNEEVLEDYKKINDGLWLEFQNNAITKEDVQVLRFKRLFQLIDKSRNYSNDESMIKNLKYLEYLEIESKLLPGASEFMKTLEKINRDTKFILATNGIEKVQKGRSKRLNLNQLFNDIIVSEEAGFSKPDLRFFQFAIDKTKTFNVDKKDMIMIGDSLTSDIKGAINFGIDSIWFNPKNLKNETEITPTFEANSFDEILKYLVD